MLEPLRLALRRHSLARNGRSAVQLAEPQEQVSRQIAVRRCEQPVQRSYREIGYCISKRALDVLVALFVLIVFVPLFLLIALIIRLDSPGPVIFRQVRVGYQGRPFTLYKFRTMYHGSSEALHRAAIARYIRGEAIGRAGSEQLSHIRFKLVYDPRVTRAGRWLRRWSLDELPQFINILRGDMTLVGPRPALPYEVEHYTAYEMQRFQVRPGLTGIWQVYGRSRVPFAEMIEMDLVYIRQRCLLLDLKLLWLTIGAVLLQRGAV